jgi:hypothetical protein
VTLPSDEMPAAPVPEAPESAPALVGPAPGPAVLPATVSDVSSFRGPARATAPAAVPTAGGPTPALTASVPEAETLTVLAERVRRTDRRWSSLAVSAEDGFVRLGGVAGTWSSVWDLADGLRRLPGVRGVRVDGVRIDASRADR